MAGSESGGATPQGSWIVIADGGRARIVRPVAGGRGYETIRSIDSGNAHRSTAARSEFGSLVLVAPTRHLAAPRAAFDAAASGRLAGSLSKDLTKVPDGELAPHLAASSA